jgi:hypothetical protein
MFDYKEPLIRKQIASILVKIAKKIEEDESFAKEIFGIDNEKETIKVKKSPPPDKVDINIFEIYQNQGSECLMNLLLPLESKDLKKIVLENGLDPSQKVRRWRKQEKIINFVVESVAKQMAKGGAFLK